jgi:hypothetical protein
MNDSDVKEVETNTNEARANRARQRLADDLRGITQAGQAMMKKTGRVGVGALIGLGALGLIMLTASLFKRKRRARNSFARYMQPKEPSFFKQAIRSVVLSALGVLATRIAQRLPLPAPPVAPPAE